MSFQRIRNHLLFWSLYVVFKTYLNSSANTLSLIALSENEWAEMIRLFLTQVSILSVKVPLVYISFYLLDGYLLRGWTLLHTSLALVATFLLAVLCLSVLNQSFILPHILKLKGETTDVFAFSSLLYHFFNLAFVTGIACSIRLFRRQHRSQLHAVELQKEKTKAELKYLKGQINPHFLFNTLNNIYSLARKGSPQTAEAVMKLSTLMRFMLYEASHASILLVEELTLIQDYIELEKLRYGDRLRIQYEESIDDPAQQIAPLLIIHFVENAFKHGASESRNDAAITIKISLSKKILMATVENTKANLTSTNPDPIGMGNIKRQLNILYPNHTLKIENKTDHFFIELTLNL